MVMVLSLAACGASEEPAATQAPKADAPAAEAPAANTELPTITFTHGYFHGESEER